MKFNKTLSRMYNVLLEADVPPADDQSMTAGPGPIVPAGDNTADAALPQPGDVDESEDKALSPEGKVYLVRLIADALTVGPADTKDMINIGVLERDGINENNVDEVLKKLIDVIEKFKTVKEV